MPAHTRRVVSSFIACALGVSGVLTQPTTSHAQAKVTTPCMEKGVPCLRPGAPYLGDNQFSLFGDIGTYNSHSSDETYLGKSITPPGGYLKVAGKDLWYVDSTGFPTLFVQLPSGPSQSGATHYSVYRLAGDRREIGATSSDYTMYDPTSGERVTFGYRWYKYAYPTTVKNALGHTVISTSYSDGAPVASIDQSEARTQFVSQNARVTSIRYPLGEVLNLAYDASGRISTISLGDQKAQSLRYDTRGNLTEVAGIEGALTLFAYNGSTLVGVGDGRGSSAAIGYDAKGVTVTHVRPGNTTFERTDVALYGDRYLPMRIGVGRGASGAGVTKASMTRDPSGVLLSFTDDRGITTSFKNQEGLPVSESSELGRVERKFDSLGRLSQESQLSPSGSLITTTTVSYDGDRVTDITVKNSDGAVVSSQSYAYTFGSDGAVSSITEKISGTNSFKYDALSRLSAASGSFGGVTVERAKNGDISSITINGVKTNTNRTYAGGETRLTSQGAGVASTYSTNLLGTRESSSYGDTKAMDVTSVSSSFSGTLLSGSSSTQLNNTNSGSAFEQRAWQSSSPLASSSARVSGPGNASGKPPVPPALPNPPKSGGGAAGDRSLGGNNPPAGSGPAGGAGGGSCCPPNARCQPGTPPCGGNGNNGGAGGGNPPAGGGGCCPPNAICQPGTPPCGGNGNNGGAGGGNPPAGGGGCCPPNARCQAGTPPCGGGGGNIEDGMKNPPAGGGLSNGGKGGGNFIR